MAVVGVIEECLGARCPTPCCQEDVFVYKEERPFVLGESSTLFTSDQAIAKRSPEKVYWNAQKSYLKYCFAEGCSFEKKKFDEKKRLPEKGIICIAFPFHILNADWRTEGVIRFDIVPGELCPLARMPEVIKNHFYRSILPTLQVRFSETHLVEFKGSLVEIMGKSTFAILPERNKAEAFSTSI
ncbi:MAG: hypothetical protein GY786_13320 [Proteobacteria bacterium]|nr:hypothetical protein [Pseudomonadota bacterium]